MLASGDWWAPQDNVSAVLRQASSVPSTAGAGDAHFFRSRIRNPHRACNSRACASGHLVVFGATMRTVEVGPAGGAHPGVEPATCWTRTSGSSRHRFANQPSYAFYFQILAQGLLPWT